MSITPWLQGDTKPSWKFPLILDSGPLDVAGLSTSNFTLILHNTVSNQETTGTGTFSNLQAGNPSTQPPTPPCIFYTPAPADVATIGQNRAYIVIMYPGGGGQETLSAGYINIEGR